MREPAVRERKAARPSGVKHAEDACTDATTIDRFADVLFKLLRGARSLYFRTGNVLLIKCLV